MRMSNRIQILLAYTHFLCV